LLESSEKLDDFLRMVDEIGSTESVAEESDRGARQLIDGLTRDFERHMSDDLQIKSAFDAVFQNVSKLLSLKRAGGLTAADCRKIEVKLGSIDSVLGVMSG
jgi:cysteinyl-tRNA synthetase